MYLESLNFLRELTLFDLQSHNLVTCDCTHFLLTDAYNMFANYSLQRAGSARLLIWDPKVLTLAAPLHPDRNRLLTLSLPQ